MGNDLFVTCKQQASRLIIAGSGGSLKSYYWLLRGKN